ncbi:helix-turn-helix transcriptional regulator [Thalassococcus profundi]|nr:helix-turn-helix transcriptional regulator [Thalassococcus profundi]
MPTRGYRRRVDVLPFEGASDLHCRLARSFALVTDWMGALTGRYEMAEVLETAAHQTGAYSVSAFRIDVTTGRADLICGVNLLGAPGTKATVSRRLAQYALQHHADRMMPGTIWRATELSKEPAFAASEAARERQGHRGLIEISLIVLERIDDRCDFMEISFETAPVRSAEIPSIIVTNAMADVWALKTPGLIDAMIAEERRRRGAPPASEQTLFHVSNPYGLTRSELGVCRLLSHGHNPKTIAETLGLSIATVRTHLRNLYAKTGTSGQVSLVSLARQDETTEDV